MDIKYILGMSFRLGLDSAIDDINSSLNIHHPGIKLNYPDRNGYIEMSCLRPVCININGDFWMHGRELFYHDSDGYRLVNKYMYRFNNVNVTNFVQTNNVQHNIIDYSSDIKSMAKKRASKVREPRKRLELIADIIKTAHIR